MTVQCPGCSTSFPVDPKKVPADGVHARCSICGEVFFVEAPPAIPAPALDVASTTLPAPFGTPSLSEPETPGAPPEALPEPPTEGGAIPWAAEEPVSGIAEPAMEEPGAAPPPWVAAEPAWEAPEPFVEAAEPAWEAPEPFVEAAEPTWEAPEPFVEAAEPAWEAPEPSVEAAEPAWEAPEPSVEAAEPAWEAPEPSVEAAEPGWEAPEPVFETAEPVSEATEAPLPEAEPEEDGTAVPVQPLYGEVALEEPEPLPEPRGGMGEATFVESAPTFGFAEPTFSMDGTGLGVEPVEEAPPLPPIQVSPPPPPPPLPPLPTPQFGRRDPKEKAQRLARVLVSDIILYNPDRHQRALEQGRLKVEFEDEIQKSWNEYVEQVGTEIANSTDFFTDALNEILAKGHETF